MDSILDGCRRTLSSVDSDCRKVLIDAIRKDRKVFVYGSGRSGLAGQLFAVRLVQLGYDVHFVGEMTTPIIGRDDLTILISYTGRTSSVVQTAQIAKRIGSQVICLTGMSGSPLSEVSDTSIVMDVPSEEELKKVAPLGTVFEDSSILFFDCIVSDLMIRDATSEEDMRNRHAIWI